MYQKTTILGHLGSDPEMRYLQSGLAVTSFRVAVNTVHRGRDDVPVKDTTWFRVSVFGKQAELCNQYLTKGRTVLVEGMLKADPTTGNPRVFERKDGSVGASFELTASQVKFVGGPSNGEMAPAGENGAAATLETVEGDEIPF